MRPYLNAQNDAASDCQSKLRVLEKELFFSCPLTADADSAIKYLDQLPDFIKNGEPQYGHGAYRYDFKNAQFSQCPLVEEKSFFFFNSKKRDDSSAIFLLDALYCFESSVDQQRQVERLKQLFEQELKLPHKTYFDVEKNPYEQYFLPCASFNFKTALSGKDLPFIRIQIEL
ncbi:MAG TPA: hypothetical protein PLO67_15025 [Saprospiraceae bacterium]|nr:hypothetical protein [Saprospiraceae bacterium]